MATTDPRRRDWTRPAAPTRARVQPARPAPGTARRLFRFHDKALLHVGATLIHDSYREGGPSHVWTIVGVRRVLFSGEERPEVGLTRPESWSDRLRLERVTDGGAVATHEVRAGYVSRDCSWTLLVEG